MSKSHFLWYVNVVINSQSSLANYHREFSLMMSHCPFVLTSVCLFVWLEYLLRYNIDLWLQHVLQPVQIHLLLSKHYSYVRP